MSIFKDRMDRVLLLGFVIALIALDIYKFN